MAQDKCTLLGRRWTKVWSEPKTAALLDRLVVFLPGIADITAFYETLSPLESREQGRGLALRRERIRRSIADMPCLVSSAGSSPCTQ